MKCLILFFVTVLFVNPVFARGLDAKNKLHIKTITELSNRPSKSYYDKASTCVRLSSYYLTLAKKKNYSKFDGHLPIVRKEVVVDLESVTTETMSKEIQLIYNCKFMAYRFKKYSLIGGRVNYDFDDTCSGCGEVWSSSLPIQVIQKLDNKSYQVNLLKYVAHSGIRKNLPDNEMYYFVTDKSYAKRQEYVFSVFGGMKSLKQKDGFSKTTPMLLDIGLNRFSALIARLKHLKSAAVGKAKCGFIRRKDYGVVFNEYGCFPKTKPPKGLSEI